MAYIIKHDLFASAFSCKIINFSYHRFALDTHLFVKVPRPGDSEVTFSVFDSCCHCYYQSNHSLVEAIPLNALPKNTTSELGRPFHTIPFLG